MLNFHLHCSSTCSGDSFTSSPRVREGFPPFYSSRWIGYSKLPLGVKECVTVCETRWWTDSDSALWSIFIRTVTIITLSVYRTIGLAMIKSSRISLQRMSPSVAFPFLRSPSVWRRINSSCLTRAIRRCLSCRSWRWWTLSWTTSWWESANRWLRLVMCIV